MNQLEAGAGTHSSLLQPVGDLLHAHIGRYSVEQWLVGGAVIGLGIFVIRKGLQKIGILDE